MKAIQVTEFGSIEHICMVNDIPKPDTIPKNKVLIKTEAVALAPGDARILSGKTREIQGPGVTPYVPGGDCCGTIVDLGDASAEDLGFNVGDRVAARFVDGPMDALAEFALVSTQMCDKVPEKVKSTDAAALASSGTVALSLSRRIQEKERVLIFGAGGGVGSHLVQLLRLRNVSYIAGVSQDPDRLISELGCDEAIDYTKQDPFSVEKWKENPFDVIIDLASGNWDALLRQMGKKNEHLIIKSSSKGGRFLTTSMDEPWYELHSILPALTKFLCVPMWRALHTRLWNRYSLPSYTFAFSLVNDRAIMRETLQLAEEGKLKACIDPRGPFSFDASSVQDAFKLQFDRHAKGKVVVDISS